MICHKLKHIQHQTTASWHSRSVQIILMSARYKFDIIKTSSCYPLYPAKIDLFVPGFSDMVLVQVVNHIYTIDFNFSFSIVESDLLVTHVHLQLGSHYICFCV